MANGDGRKALPRSKRDTVAKRFFLEGSLYKVLSANRAQDIVIVWDYNEGKRKAFVWTDIKKRKKKAYSVVQVGELLDRSKNTIKKDIVTGRIKTPMRACEPSSKRTIGTYFFTEQDILDYHDYLSGVTYYGNKKTFHKNMISKVELRALMADDVMKYVKNKQGEFVPIWKEIDW